MNESKDMMNEQYSVTSPVTVFYSYAHADERLRKQLEKHLSLLRQKGTIAEWHDRDIVPGTDWAQEIDARITTASIILLLISPDFLASDYCYGVEMQQALAKHDTGEACVIPIILRPVDWDSAPFARLQCLPRDGKPVTKWLNRDDAFRDVARGIRRVVERLRTFPGSPHHFSLLSTTSSFPSQGSAQLFMAADLPDDFVARPHEFEALKQSILHGQRERPTAITAALRGAGGYGKTTLAQALCHDPDIQNAFRDGILWVTLGDKPVNLVAKIEELISLLSHEQLSFTSVETAMAKLRSTLANRACLLVIDDVWRSSNLIPFLQGGTQCARLITTRNDQVLPQSAVRIQVDAMHPSEAVQLLQAGLEDEPHIHELEPLFQSLAGRLGEWPLLLTLANGVLRQRIRLGESLMRTIDYLQRTLNKRGILAFDANNPQARSEAAAKTLEVSFEQLTADEVVRYEELAIFPGDIAIPLVTVQRLWQATGGLDELDTERVCQRLFNLSLLLSYDLTARHIRLHDVVRNYLQFKLGNRLPTLHRQFLDSYGLIRWADLSFHEPYLWEHLAEHLVAAERTDVLVEVVKDPRYLAAKSLARGTSAMEQDLVLASRQVPGDVILILLIGQIAKIAHLLKRGRTLQEVIGILLSYLHHGEGLTTLCTSCEQQMSRPWLTTWHPPPDQYTLSTIRTLVGHSEGVFGCAVSPDGAWIVSASADNTLKVWDAQTGSERFTFRGHTETVLDCAVSPDGTWIVSASEDGTLRIWDSRTGARRRTLYGHAVGVRGCAVSPDGECIVSASYDGTLRTWDARTGARRRTLYGHQGGVVSCAVSPDGTWIVSASEDGTLKVWDAQTGVEQFTLQGHTNAVYSCAVSPDGIWIASTSEDGTLKMWNVNQRRCVATFYGEGPLIRCTFHLDGEHLISVGEGGVYFLRFIC